MALTACGSSSLVTDSPVLSVIVSGYEIEPGANLYRANLSDADLSGANLERANLNNAKLTYANLTGANLLVVNIEGADLTGANLNLLYFTSVNLTGATMPDGTLSTDSIEDNGQNRECNSEL